MTKTTVQYEGYAESIIADTGRIGAYDALEIQGVRDLNADGQLRDVQPGQTCCEVDNENPQFFSVYGHLKDGGSECFGDFETPEDARQYAKTLSEKYGLPIAYDCVPANIARVGGKWVRQ